MMMTPAARSKCRLSGILTMEFAGTAIFSRAPLWPQDATTRSPTFRPVTPEPTLSITPATSAAGENGNGGLIWYLPWIIKRSKKFSAADLIAITASPGPATGSGTSVSTRSSGPQYCEQRTAFMDTPDFRTHSLRLEHFLPDLRPGYNLIRMPGKAVIPGRAQREPGISRGEQDQQSRDSGSSATALVRNDGHTDERESTDV